MMRRAGWLSGLVVLSLLSAVGATGCHRGHRSSPARALPPAEAARVLIDRNWMDLWPENEHQRLHVFRFTPAMGGGVYQDRTLFKGTFELFRFAIDGVALEIELPETGEHVRTGYRIERVNGPAPFDLRLTLERSPRGPSVYYGRTDETAGDGLALPSMR